MDIRHLHYRVFPVTKSGTWQWNVRKLLRHWDLFNGVKVISIATQEPYAAYKLDPPDYVRAMFEGRGCSFIEMRNNPRLREVVSFIPALDIISARPGDNSAIFFGHTKGVTRHFDSKEAIFRWTNLLYELCLDYWPVADRRLQRFPACGALKKLGTCFEGSRSDWHYAGSFYWLRAADLFARNWHRIDHNEYGSESYPSIHFKKSEAAYLGYCGEEHQMNLYHMPHLRSVEREVGRWKSKASNILSRSG